MLANYPPNSAPRNLRFDNVPDGGYFVRQLVRIVFQCQHSDLRERCVFRLLDRVGWRQLGCEMWSISAIRGGQHPGISPPFIAKTSVSSEHQQHLFSDSFFSILTICLLCLAPPAALGQAVYGSIFGTVTDQTGAVLPNVHLVLTSLERGAKLETLSNATGNYEISHLLPGQYSLKAEASGFKISEITGLPVHVDQATRVDLRLRVGGSSETIEVSAKDVPLLKTDRADVSITFDQRVILDVPLAVKGNFTALELLAPGTSILGWQHASSENPQGSIQINVNGQNWSQTSYQLDGTDNRDPILGIIVINPNPEAVTEAKITTQNFDGEFGQALAGVISTQTKSGTNSFHGSVAPSHHGGGSPIPKFLQVPGLRIPIDNLWTVAGSLGGPIIKNRLFFFGDYVAERLNRAAAGRFNVPTTLVRGTCLNLNSVVCDLSEYPRQIWDPASGNTVAFPNNQIPKNRISQQAIALLKLIPAPNVANAGFNQNYLATGIDVFDDDRFDVRIDHILSPKLQYFGRYSFADFRRYAPPAFGDLAGGIGLLDGFPGRAPARNQSLALGFNYLLTDTLLADFRFGFFRYHVNDFNSSYGTTPAKDAGIPNLNFDHGLTSGMPFMQVDGQDGDDFTMGSICNCPLFQTEQQFQWVNNWTKAHNSHSIKWGADIRYAQNLRVPSLPVRVGGMEFNNSRTQGPGLTGGGLGLATFLLGDATSFGRTVSTVLDAGERQNRWYFYGQDTWRVTPKLTLNYGLRWEMYFPQFVTGKGQGGWLDLNTGEIRVAGYGDINRQGNVKRALGNFAPRIGIAYTLSSKTVVRLGYGRSHDLGVFGTIFGHTVTQNLPVLVQQQIGTSSPTDLVFQLKDGPPPPSQLLVPTTGRFMLPDQVRTFALPDKMRLPTVDAWNLTVQRAITPTLSLQAGYVANKGTHVFPGDGPFYDLNQPSIVGFGTLNHFERQPFYKKFGWTQEIAYSGSNASNTYNALQVQADKRFSSGYEFQAHYTWSKALGYNNDYFAIDPKVNYGIPDSNRKHAFVLVNVIDLPFGKGRPYFKNLSHWKDWMIGGWTLAGNTTVYSGLPFTPTYLNCGGVDIDTGPCRPNLVGKVHITGRRSGYFTTTNGVVLQPHGTPGDTVGPWQRPAFATFGDIRRNSLYGPGFWQTDMDVKKSFRFSNDAAFEIRIWISNVFNKVNLNNPVTCVDCLDGGKILGADGGRGYGYDLRFQF
ncbi:MAG: hypothetical protein DMG84_07090 [Acidobacteria bacterium]|nr:MAG: hypothetical protein DMG84_07090 [Acidobacteriota bacterium]